MKIKKIMTASLILILMVDIPPFLYSMFLIFAWVIDHVNPGLGAMVDIKRTLICAAITTITIVIIFIILHLIFLTGEKN